MRKKLQQQATLRSTLPDTSQLSSKRCMLKKSGRFWDISEQPQDQELSPGEYRRQLLNQEHLWRSPSPPYSALERSRSCPIATLGDGDVECIESSSRLSSTNTSLHPRRRATSVHRTEDCRLTQTSTVGVYRKRSNSLNKKDLLLQQRPSTLNPSNQVSQSVKHKHNSTWGSTRRVTSEAINLFGSSSPTPTVLHKTAASSVKARPKKFIIVVDNSGSDEEAHPDQQKDEDVQKLRVQGPSVSLNLDSPSLPTATVRSHSSPTVSQNCQYCTSKETMTLMSALTTTPPEQYPKLKKLLLTESGSLSKTKKPPEEYPKIKKKLFLTESGIIVKAESSEERMVRRKKENGGTYFGDEGESLKDPSLLPPSWPSSLPPLFCDSVSSSPLARYVVCCA